MKGRFSGIYNERFPSPGENAAICIFSALFQNVKNGALSLSKYSEFNLSWSSFNNCTSSFSGASILITPGAESKTRIKAVCTYNSSSPTDTNAGGQSLCLTSSNTAFELSVYQYTAVVAQGSYDIVIFVGGNSSIKYLNATLLNVLEYGVCYFGSTPSYKCKSTMFTVVNCSCDDDLMRCGDEVGSISELSKFNVVENTASRSILSNYNGNVEFSSSIILRNKNTPKVASIYSQCKEFKISGLSSDIPIGLVTVGGCIENYKGPTYVMHMIVGCQVETGEIRLKARTGVCLLMQLLLF